jgi:hypothetical protein
MPATPRTKAPKKASPKARSSARPATDTPPAGDLLAGWCKDGAASIEQVVTALGADDPSVDAFLAGPAASLGFASKLLGEHVFEIGIALEDCPPVSGARWVALASLDPHAFAWNLDAETLLPLDDASASRDLEALLLHTLSSREDRAVLLRWLSHPAFLGEEDAIDRIEQALAAAGAAMTWDDRLDTLKILTRRGGGWQAARALEHLLRRSTPDADAARRIHARAVPVADATLLGVLGNHEPWASTPDWMREIADKVSTADLIEAFAPASGERLARRAAERPGPARRAAWMTLARRPEPVATDTVGRLIVRAAVFVGDEALAAGLTATLVAERGEAAVPTLVAAFLAGLHRRAPGAAVERLLRDHPEKTLRASLDLLPDWVHTFEPDAMARLAFRVLPKLPADRREVIADLARLHDGQRALILLDELEAL